MVTGKAKRFSILLAVILIFSMMPTMAQAATSSTEYRLPAVGSDSPYFGPYGSSSWLDPGSIVNDGGSFAMFYAHVGTHSYYLKGSSFGFNESMIPLGSTVTGIEVALRRIATPGADIRDFIVSLIDAEGNLVPTNKAKTNVSWPTDNDGALLGNEGITTTYGGSNDLWGTSWTLNDIFDSDFGAALSVVINASDGTDDSYETAVVDSMKIKVYFVPPADTTAPTAIVTTASLTVGSNVTTAQSSELGSVYLVNTTSTVTDKASLDALVTSGAAAKSAVIAINTNTAIGTAGLEPGTYYVYAADEAGNVSLPSAGVITLTAPADITAPTASVTTATLTVGSDVTTAQSSELGSVYLVSTESTVTGKASMDSLVTLGAAAKSAVTAINIDTAIGTAGLAPGTYNVYAADEAGNVSLPSAGIITLAAPADTTAPTASVTTATLTVGSDVTTAQSSELGSVYLVSTESTVTDKASLDALVSSGAAAKSAVIAINTDTAIGTSGLEPGTYNVYAVDEAGNVSSKSEDIITLTAPADTIAPTASVTTASLTVGSDVTTAQSSELGSVYLVNSSSTVTDKASLDALVTSGAAASSIVTAINANIAIGTAGLEPGTYNVYAADEAGNVSLPSAGIITLTAPIQRVVTTIKISGKDTITIPTRKNTKIDYRAKVFDQFGRAMSGIPITWSIEGTGPTGVTINDVTGQISILKNAVEATFDIKALNVTSGKYDIYTITLVNK